MEMQTTNPSVLPAVFAEECAAIAYDTSKGIKLISGEGALFKGGKALAAYKDAALDSALAKAHNGRYRVACDVIGAAFPGVHAAFEKIVGLPYRNSDSMRVFLRAIEKINPPAGKEFSKKQEQIRTLVRALREVPALAKEENAEQADVVSVQ